MATGDDRGRECQGYKRQQVGRMTTGRDGSCRVFSILLLFAIVAGTLNLSPRLLGPPGGDAFFHYALIDCFSQEFWKGEVSPHWCMQANGGLGSPVLLFYFPLPYYITALFYPLHYLGLATEQQYLMGIWLANVVTFLSWNRWLADMVSPGRAILGAFLMLWMPYRMELIVTRSAYAELWCMAFLPLLFLAVRRLVTREKHYPLILPVALALCLLSHLPATLLAMLGCSVYMMVMIQFRWRQWVLFAYGVVCGVGLAAFYLVPGSYFLDALHPQGLEALRHAWVNSFVVPEEDVEHGRTRLLLVGAYMAFFAFLLAGNVFSRRRLVRDAMMRREITAWALILIFAFFMLFEPSAPVWAVLKAFAPIFAPRRMQLLILSAAVYFFAVYSQWMMTENKLRTWKWEYVGLCGFFALLSLAVSTERPPWLMETAQQAMQDHIVVFDEYLTRWTERPTRQSILAQIDRHHTVPRVHLIEGEGLVQITQWNNQGICMSAMLESDGVLSLEQLYFPTWFAKLDGVAHVITPEAGSGHMQLFVPAGRHVLWLYTDTYGAIPAPLRWIMWGGMLVALSLLCLAYKLQCHRG